MFLPFFARHPWMKAGFFRFLMKPVAVFASRGLFLQKPWTVLLLRGVGSVEILVFNPSEASESLFLAISAHPRARKVCFCYFLLSRGLG